MHASSFKSMAKHLTVGGAPRVWSLLVTVFGELALNHGVRISGSLLRQLSEQMGIKPEAMRVALHRLRKDGWIKSERTGRTSEYFLTEWGRAQSMQASPRIYAAGPAADAGWLVLANPASPTPMEDADGAWISSNVLIMSVPPETVDVFATPIKPTEPLPLWISSKVCDADTVRMSQDFESAVESMRSSMGPEPQMNNVEIAALRVLLVHSWRRIILKAPVLPDHLFPEGWRGAECRANVVDLLSQFPKQDLAGLEDAVSDVSPYRIGLKV